MNSNEMASLAGAAVAGGAVGAPIVWKILQRIKAVFDKMSERAQEPERLLDRKIEAIERRLTTRIGDAETRSRERGDKLDTSQRELEEEWRRMNTDTQVKMEGLRKDYDYLKSRVDSTRRMKAVQDPRGDR